MDEAGLGYTLWQVRVPDVNGEITKAMNSDVEASGENVRKIRTLKALENVENVENLRVAISGTDPNGIREGISLDRLPLTKWRDPSGRVLLIADGNSHSFPSTESFSVALLWTPCLTRMHSSWRCKLLFLHLMKLRKTRQKSVSFLLKTCLFQARKLTKKLEAASKNHS